MKSRREAAFEYPEKPNRARVFRLKKWLRARLLLRLRRRNPFPFPEADKSRAARAARHQQPKHGFYRSFLVIRNFYSDLETAVRARNYFKLLPLAVKFFEPFLRIFQTDAVFVRGILQTCAIVSDDKLDKPVFAAAFD